MATMPGQVDADLMLCREHGLAYQLNRRHLVPYDGPYYEKCASYEGDTIARAINAGRIDLVSRYVGMNRVLDVGIGSGEFVKLRPNTWGCDINPVAIEWLKRNDLWSERLCEFAGVTMWDVIEHLPDPDLYLRQINLHGYLFVSIPVFASLDAIRESKHYRPGEHLTYWTPAGFEAWIDRHGFAVRERAEFESQAGRENITSYALQKYRRAS
jgi:Methyltransferase domain